MIGCRAGPHGGAAPGCGRRRLTATPGGRAGRVAVPGGDPAAGDACGRRRAQHRVRPLWRPARLRMCRHCADADSVPALFQPAAGWGLEVADLPTALSQTCCPPLCFLCLPPVLCLHGCGSLPSRVWWRAAPRAGPMRAGLTCSSPSSSGSASWRCSARCTTGCARRPVCMRHITAPSCADVLPCSCAHAVSM